MPDLLLAIDGGPDQSIAIEAGGGEIYAPYLVRNPADVRATKAARL